MEAVQQDSGSSRFLDAVAVPGTVSRFHQLKGSAVCRPMATRTERAFSQKSREADNVLWKDQCTGVLAGCFVRVPERIRKRSKPSPGRKFVHRGCETVDACAGYRSIVALLYGLEIPQLTVVTVQTGFVALQWGTSKYLVVAICKLRFRPTITWNYIGRNGKVCGATRSWSWCLLRQPCRCGDEGSTECPSCMYRTTAIMIMIMIMITNGDSGVSRIKTRTARMIQVRNR